MSESILLTALICFVSTLAAIDQFSRARASAGTARAIWASGGGIAVACGLLATALVLMGTSAQGSGGILGALAALAGVVCATAMRRAALVANGPLPEDLNVRNNVLDSVLSYMSQGVCMFDAENKLIFWNRRYGELYNVQDRLRIGMALRDMLQLRTEAGTFSGDADKFVAEVYAALKQGVLFKHLFEMKDGARSLSAISRGRGAVGCLPMKMSPNASNWSTSGPGGAA